VERILNAKEKKSFMKLFNPAGSARKTGNNDITSVCDAFGITPLHWACVNGHRDIVQLLIEHGAPVNATNEVEDTPLHWAALGGHKEIAAHLIKKGALVEAKNRAGQTPLHMATNEEVGKVIEGLFCFVFCFVLFCFVFCFDLDR
jgi:ankyrin repeat protein